MAKALKSTPIASSSKPAPAPAAAQPKKRALASAEIDDIFSKKPKLSTVPTPIAEPPKKNKGKGKATTAAAPEEKPAKKGKAPETIMDTSAGIDSYRVAAPVVKKRKAGEDGVGASGEGAGKEMEEEDRFMDSRGTNRASFSSLNKCGANLLGW